MHVEHTMLSMLFRALLLVLSAKMLHAAFGWATVMLLGRVPQKRQSLLSVIAFGAVAWMIVLVGAIVPPLASLLVGSVLPSDAVDQSRARLILLAIAIGIPLVVGFVSLFMLEPKDRPHGVGARARAVLMGYPYTLGLAITLVMMTVLAPMVRAQNLFKRWTSQNVPVIVEPDRYLEVVGDLEKALRAGGIETERRQASWVFRYPTKVLTFFAGGALPNAVADELTTLKSGHVEVLLHPSDLAIRGREREVARARAIVEEQLAFSRAYMTWTKEANELEDRLCSIWNDLKERPDGSARAETAAKLQAVERDLRAVMLPHEEWEVMLREKLLIERAFLRMAANIADKPKDLTEATRQEMVTTTVP
jgi:hypothetical protein